MTNTVTADIESTSRQCVELAEAGSELVRITVDTSAAAAAVPEIKRRLVDAGCPVPLIGDFHHNGHVLLTKFPECALALDKFRINPGNVGQGDSNELSEAFRQIIEDYVEDSYSPIESVSVES